MICKKCKNQNFKKILKDKDKTFTGREISKLFNSTLKENGYTKIQTKLWNQRPNYWKLK